LGKKIKNTPLLEPDLMAKSN